MISISWIDASYIWKSNFYFDKTIQSCIRIYFYLAINFQNLNQPIHIIDCISNEEWLDKNALKCVLARILIAGKLFYSSFNVMIIRLGWWMVKKKKKKKNASHSIFVFFFLSWLHILMTAQNMSMYNNWYCQAMRGKTINLLHQEISLF